MQDDFEEYRPVKGRKKLLVVLLAVTTAIGVVLMILYPPGGPDRSKRAPTGPQRCVGQQTLECIGGKVDLIMPPSVPASGG